MKEVAQGVCAFPIAAVEVPGLRNAEFWTSRLIALLSAEFLSSRSVFCVPRERQGEKRVDGGVPCSFGTPVSSLTRVASGGTAKVWEGVRLFLLRFKTVASLHMSQ